MTRIRDLIKTAYDRVLTRKHPLLDRSEVFCMAPWIQLHAQTNGKISPCCMSAVHSQNEIGDLRENPNLEDAWNSENMKKLRLDMLNKRKNSLCAHCYKYEKIGRFSERMQYNRDYKNEFSRIENTKPDGSVEDVNVLLIDIRFSNKCNYKCRICNSEFSSLWYEEEQKMPKGLVDHKPKEMRAAADDKIFWESYKKMLPHARRLHFAGGEPLFMDEHYETLEELIAIGNKEVVLSYNTNFSTLRYKKYNVIDLWNQFHKVDIWASLDGMFEKGDYQRKGQKWEKVEENIRTMQQECPSALFGVNVTVSIFNVLDIPAFYKYMVENKFVQPERFNLYLLFAPDYFNITNLTPDLKQKVTKLYKDFEKNYLNTLTNPENMINHVRAVLAYMTSSEATRSEEFKKHVDAVDAIRDENFALTYPELAEMVNR